MTERKRVVDDTIGLTLFVHLNDFIDSSRIWGEASTVNLRVAFHQSLIQFFFIVTKKGLMNEITTKVEGNQLIIKRENHDQKREEVTVYLTLPKLVKVKINSDVKLNCTNVLKSEALEVNVSGVLSGNLNLTASSLNIQSNGVLKLKATGSANVLSLDMPGVGTADMLNFKVKKANVEINGVGNALVNAEEYLDAEVNGVGKVNYKGQPQLKVKVSGIGRVKEI